MSFSFAIKRKEIHKRSKKKKQVKLNRSFRFHVYLFTSKKFCTFSSIAPDYKTERTKDFPEIFACRDLHRTRLERSKEKKKNKTSCSLLKKNNN